MNLVVDCATTSLWQWKLPGRDPRQPHLVRIAAVLLDAEGKVVDHLCHVIRPLPGWGEITAEASNVHKVTRDYARAHGVELGAALGRLNAYLRDARRLIGHSISFHERVLTKSYGDYGLPIPPELAGHRLERFCTMRESADICQVRLQANNMWKWPSLSEATEHFAGATLHLPDDPIERGKAQVLAVALCYDGIADARARAA